MDFTKPPQTAQQPSEIERLAHGYCLREATAGRLGRSFGSTKLIGDTVHHFLVLDRRPANVDLDAIARVMLWEITAEKSAGETLSPLPSPLFSSVASWCLHGWAILRRTLWRAKT